MKPLTGTVLTINVSPRRGFVIAWVAFRESIRAAIKGTTVEIEVRQDP